MKDIADIVPTHITASKEVPKRLEVGALDFDQLARPSAPATIKDKSNRSVSRSKAGHSQSRRADSQQLNIKKIKSNIVDSDQVRKLGGENVEGAESVFTTLQQEVDQMSAYHNSTRKGMKDVERANSEHFSNKHHYHYKNNN